MVTAQTMEQVIAELERKGWRLSNLSHLRANGQWSAILERRKAGSDGFGVYASGIADDPATALRAAWEQAQKPLEQTPTRARPVQAPAVLTLADALADRLGVRLRLEDAVKALINAHNGVEHDDEDFL